MPQALCKNDWSISSCILISFLLVLRVIRAQLKPVYHTADNRSEKFTSTFNHESRYAYSSPFLLAAVDLEILDACSSYPYASSFYFSGASKLFSRNVLQPLCKPRCTIAYVLRPRPKFTDLVTAGIEGG